MLVPGLAPHDAVSNDVIGMTAVLRADGHEVALFAPHAQCVDETVHAPDAITAWLTSRDDIVIYHYAIGWDFALQLFRRTRARRVVRYHNITPAEFFTGWSPGYVDACAAGRVQIQAFADLACDLYLGASTYNIDDFLQCGVDAQRCEVLAPFHEVERLLMRAADSTRLPPGSPLLLMVGRLSPNKGHLDLYDALALCKQGVAPAAHLLSVGKLDPNLGRYGEALHARAALRGVQAQLTLLQDASSAELRAAFERATALVMLSRHEGFCVPLVEAMALGTPVIALRSSAIASTLGDAGLLFESADPHLIAAAIARVHGDVQLRATLGSRGHQRYREHFAPDVLKRRLRAIMARFR